MRHVAVLGAGSWGTALAIHLARSGHEVRLWARDPATVRDIRDRRANVVYLPDIMLPDAVSPTDSLEDAVAGSELVVWGAAPQGGRYSPSTDSWTPISTGANAPTLRYGFAAAWTARASCNR